MRANDQNTLRLLGEQAKDTTTNRARLNNLTAYLRGLPSLDFSEKGRTNICCRFRVSAEELADAVAGLQQPRPGKPTPELLRIIGNAVGCVNTAKGGQGHAE